MMTGSTLRCGGCPMSPDHGMRQVRIIGDGCAALSLAARADDLAGHQLTLVRPEGAPQETDHIWGFWDGPELAAASHRYRHNTPASKEAFYYRSLFESLFPQNAAAATVPGGASVACSSPEAMVWDEGFAGMDEPSGRAMTGVHREAY